MSLAGDTSGTDPGGHKVGLKSQGAIDERKEEAAPPS